MSNKTRQCPFQDCSTMIEQGKFACSKHWYSLTQAHRNRIWAAFRAYLADKIDLAKLREIQADTLAIAQAAKK